MISPLIYKLLESCLYVFIRAGAVLGQLRRMLIIYVCSAVFQLRLLRALILLTAYASVFPLNGMAWWQFKHNSHCIDGRLAARLLGHDHTQLLYSNKEKGSNTGMQVHVAVPAEHLAEPPKYYCWAVYIAIGTVASLVSIHNLDILIHAWLAPVEQ